MGRARQTGGTWHVSAPPVSGTTIEFAVDGERVRFWSGDSTLSVTPEAAALAFLQPALERRVHLAVTPAVSTAWRDRSDLAVSQLAAWFGYEPHHPVTSTQTAGRSSPRAAGRGLCFTGGVDSWWSLLVEGPPPTHLLFVRGFDIWLSEDEKFHQFQPTLRRAAADVGAEAIVVATDLRHHSRHFGTSWERGHGAAIAATGLLLENTIGQLRIPSSAAQDEDLAWGSSPLLDRYLTTPERVEIVHGEASLTRRAKLAEIGDHPLVRNSLRVCLNGSHPTGNCSACEKCVRTMVSLELNDQLGGFASAFDLRTPLVERIGSVPMLTRDHLVVWRSLYRDAAGRPELRRAIGRLIARATVSGVGRTVRRRIAEARR